MTTQIRWMNQMIGGTQKNQKMKNSIKMRKEFFSVVPSYVGSVYHDGIEKNSSTNMTDYPISFNGYAKQLARLSSSGERCSTAFHHKERLRFSSTLPAPAGKG